MKLQGNAAGHREPVLALCFAPDGKTLASGGSDNRAELWDVETGKNTVNLLGHTGGVRSVAFTPDGKTLVTSGFDKTIRVWDAATGKNTTTIETGFKESLDPVSLSPDGKTVAATGGTSKIQLWDVETGKLKDTRDKGGLYVCAHVKFMPDGKSLAYALIRPGFQELEVSAPAGQPPVTFDRGLGAKWVNVLAVSPDGKRLAWAEGEQTISLLEIGTRNRPPAQKGLLSPMMTLAFSGDSKLLFGWPREGSLRSWDARTGGDERDVRQGVGGASVLAVSPDGQRLATASRNGQAVALWDAVNKKEVATLAGSERPPRSASFSADGKRLLVGYEGGVFVVWDVATAKVIGRPPTAADLAAPVAFSPDGALVAVNHPKGVVLYEATGANAVALDGVTGPVFSLGFSPDGKTLATGDRQGGTVRLWDVTNGKEKGRLEGHEKPVRAIAFHPGGKLIATGGVDRVVKLWDVTTGKEVQALGDHTDFIAALAFSPDGKLLATSALDRTVRVYDINAK